MEQFIRIRDSAQGPKYSSKMSCFEIICVSEGRNANFKITQNLCHEKYQDPVKGSMLPFLFDLKVQGDTWCQTER